MNQALDLRPRLVGAARLRLEAQTGSYVLLSPERGLRLNASASEVVRLCTGERTTRQIIDALVQALSGKRATQELPLGDRVVVPRRQVTDDVLSLLGALYRRNLLAFEGL